MPSTTWIFVYLLTGSFGMGYFIYGKKTGKPIPMIAGVLLSFYVYFITALWLAILIGVLLIALPFIIKWEF